MVASVSGNVAVRRLHFKSHRRQTHSINDLKQRFVAEQAFQHCRVRPIEHHPQRATAVQPPANRGQPRSVFNNATVGDDQLIECLPRFFSNRQELIGQVQQLAVADRQRSCARDEIKRNGRFFRPTHTRPVDQSDQPLSIASPEHSVPLQCSRIAANQDLAFVRCVHDQRTEIKSLTPHGGTRRQQDRMPCLQSRHRRHPDSPAVLQSRLILEIRRRQNLDRLRRRIRQVQSQHSPFSGDIRIRPGG